jgi:hypothetical protein
MSKGILKEGGPHNIQQVGENQYSVSVSMPSDENGRTARECLSEECSPGYFKVTPGTGITGGQPSAFCPYCRHEAEPSDFMTREQRRYAEELLMQEVLSGVDDMVKDAFGLDASGRRKMGGGFISMEMTYKPGPKPHVMRPFEEEVRRDVVCPHCTLDQSVYGLATWCADCGMDIFLTHVDSELAVIRKMLSDVDRRRELLGDRIAARDLENCLEDAVSIFEAVLRYLVRRSLVFRGKTPEETEEALRKMGSAFQNLTRAQEIFDKDLSTPLFKDISPPELEHLEQAFEKRHPITHNLGVVDKKHIERARTNAEEGKEVLVTAAEIEAVMAISGKVFASVHARLFPVM